MSGNPEGELDDLLAAFPARILEVADRVMVFIDWAYVVRGAQGFQGSRAVSVARLALKLAGRRRLIRTYLYDGRLDNPPATDYWRSRQQAQQRLEAALAHAPSVEIRWGRVQFSGDGEPRQKGVDVLVSLDMLRFALTDNYDRAILVSGDGDFADIVRMVKDEGKTVEVAMFQSSRAWSLVQAADVLVNLDARFLEGCWQ